MPTTSRPHRQASAAPEPALDRLREQVTLLRHEQEDLPAAINEAMAATDVEAWMRLTVRQRDLPGLIGQARIALIPAEVDAAWAVVRPLQAVEDDAHRAQKSALKAANFWTAPIKALQALELPEQIERKKDLDELERADAALQQARQATAHALHAVDVLDAEHLELTGEPLPVTRDRPGPRRLASSVMVARNSYLDDGETLPEPLPFADHLTSGAFTLEAGDEVPRWHAHLLGEHVFEPVTVTA